MIKRSRQAINTGDLNVIMASSVKIKTVGILEERASIPKDSEGLYRRPSRGGTSVVYMISFSHLPNILIRLSARFCNGVR